MKYFEFAVSTARDTFTSSRACDPQGIHIDSLTISADAMPGHYIARAVTLDLEPHNVVSALAATLHAIREQYPVARRTGWTACNDGLRVYFYCWSATAWTIGGRHAA